MSIGQENLVFHNLKGGKEDSVFAKKSSLETLSYPQSIVDRETKTEDLVRLLLGYKQEYVVPLISVYGRSGSGKSTIVRFVCPNLSRLCIVCTSNRSLHAK